MKKIIQSVHAFLKKYEHYTMPIILIGGFIIDNLTLTQIDRLFENMVLFVYVSISAIMLYILYGPQPEHPWKIHATIKNFAPFILQYCIGGLFSGLFIFYFRSGTLITSLPFLLVLFVLMAGNEYFYRKFPKASFQLVIFFIALLSYINLIVPLITKKMGSVPFIGATLFATIIMYTFVAILDQPNGLVHGKHRKQLHRRLFVTLCIFITLYFTNVIPPLPLSMKEGAIGYAISKQQNMYAITVEKAPWYMPLSEYGSRVSNQGTLYAFSAIYAPIDINTDIFHRWSRYDEVHGWVEMARLPIAITGGRQDGYRGFSFKQNVAQGDWRVDVITEQGQIMGRMNMTVVTQPPQALQIITH